MLRRVLAIVGLVATGTAAAAAAQTASIRGIVHDSLLGRGALPGVLVELVELGRVARTNGQGVFRFDSLPGGTWTLSFTDSALSAIGFSPPDRPARVGDGIDIAVILATPSAATLYRSLCSAAPEPATGVLLGTLRDARTGHPIAGGEVRGDWTVSTLDRDVGFIRRPQVVRAAADSSGRFRLCGLPNDVPVLLRATAVGVQGPPLDLRLDGRVFAVRHLTLDPASAGDHAGVLTGRISSPKGPLAGAQVVVLGDERIGRTDAAGRFRIDGLAAGTHTLEARAIGYLRRREAVEIPPTGEVTLDLSLEAQAVELPDLDVTATAGTGISGYDRRRRASTGGRFITREEIDRRQVIRTEELFRTVPGMRLEQTGLTEYRILSTRGGAGFSTMCEPTVFVDDVRIPLDPANGLTIPVQPEELEGIEVYQGQGSIPAQYRAVGQNCGVILIWTRRGRR